MRKLIQQILKEYTNPVLVYEIVISQTLLEDDFMRYLEKSDKNVILFKNEHSEETVGIPSKFARVDPKIIDDSIKDIQNDIIELSKKVIENCKGKKCSIMVIDYMGGFDYHMWLRKNKAGNIMVIINTSIYHPKHLFNSENSPTIIVDKYGNISYTNLT